MNLITVYNVYYGDGSFLLQRTVMMPAIRRKTKKDEHFSTHTDDLSIKFFYSATQIHM